MIGQQVFSPKTKWLVVYFLLEYLIFPNVSLDIQNGSP